MDTLMCSRGQHFRLGRRAGSGFVTFVSTPPTFAVVEKVGSRIPQSGVFCFVLSRSVLNPDC